VVTFQRLIRRDNTTADAINLFFERRSRNFGALGTLIASNPFEWEGGGGYSFALTEYLFAGVEGRYSRGRDTHPDIYSARSTLSARLTNRLSLSGELRWEKDNFERRFSGLLTATLRLGRSSNLRTEYDTKYERSRLSYSTFRGSGVGSYNIGADIDHSPAGSGVNVTANYFANRAELGLSHFGFFDNLFGDSRSQRTSARFATSLAFADGAVSIGRPINDSFAIVKGHRSLKGASILIEPTPFGRVAETGALGTGVHPVLASYLNRTVTVDAPEAPATVDLGQGSFRLMPPYRSGYLLTVGSAFNVTAVGRLVGTEDKPLSLVSGIIRSLDQATGEPIAFFTNREGRFGAIGLGPGKWQVEMADEARSRFIINIPTDAEGIVKVGDLHTSSRTP